MPAENTKNVAKLEPKCYQPNDQIAQFFILFILLNLYPPLGGLSVAEESSEVCQIDSGQRPPKTLSQRMQTRAEFTHWLKQPAKSLDENC